MGKLPYLLDVALDELWGGHQLGRQTLFQLQFADWLAPFGPAGTTEGQGREGLAGQTVTLEGRWVVGRGVTHPHTCKLTSKHISQLTVKWDIESIIIPSSTDYTVSGVLLMLLPSGKVEEKSNKNI